MENSQKNLEKKANKNNNLDVLGFSNPKMLEWLEMRPFGDPTSDEDWVAYCARWEEYESKRTERASR